MVDFSMAIAHEYLKIHCIGSGEKCPTQYKKETHLYLTYGIQVTIGFIFNQRKTNLKFLKI